MIFCKLKDNKIITADGSHSLYVKGLDEQYHSIHGAIAESRHIFIELGLLEQAKSKKSIRVLEIGMGTGLNVFLTALYAEQKQLKIEMMSLEPFPIDLKAATGLNYPEKLNAPREIFEKIHEFPWMKWEEFSPFFRFHKVNAKLQNFNLSQEWDLIYFDAFAPEKQTEMWNETIFQKLFAALTAGGILVTYCIKGIIRRRLEKIGFTVEKVPGPVGGKREMMRARKLKD